LLAEEPPTRFEISQAGDLAYELGTYRLRMDPPEGRVDDTGKYFSVWKKTGDNWELVVDAPSTNLPAAGTAGGA
jgi:ketosteroid isomerase-like protein